MSKTIIEAKPILENMLLNHSQWHTERAPNPSSRKVNSIEEIDSLSSKINTIFSYISKQNIDNVPLQDLVGNNSENVDVNYIRNFGNNGYGNNNYNNSYSKPPFVPNKFTSGNNFFNDLENTIRSFIASQKELNKDFISRFEKQDVLNEKVERLTNEVLSLKNIIQSQKDHE